MGRQRDLRHSMSLDGPRILVIEDEQEIRRFLRLSLAVMATSSSKPRPAPMDCCKLRPSSRNC